MINYTPIFQVLRYLIHLKMMPYISCMQPKPFDSKYHVLCKSTNALCYRMTHHITNSILIIYEKENDL